MKKNEMKELVCSAIATKDLCRAFFKYDTNYRYCFPLLASCRLFLSANENDFSIDGFSVRSFSDLKKISLRRDKYAEIVKSENVFDCVSIPEIDLTNWQSVFLSLQVFHKNIIIEKESLDEKECEFAIGRIEKVQKNKVLFKYFDADGVWQDGLLEIPFSQITSVTFGSRYVEIFSKYV